VSIVLGNVNCGLEHQYREGNSWNPADEADNAKHREYNKDYVGTTLLPHDVYNSSPNAKNNLQYSGNPYDSFGKCLCHLKVCQADDESSYENESTEMVSKDWSGGEGAYKSMIVFVERPTILAPPYMEPP